MNTKQTLLLGGGTVFGALAAVALMNVKTSDDTDTASGSDGPNSKLESARTKGQPDDEAAASRIKIKPDPDQVVENAPEIDPQELAERRDEFRNEMRERQMDRLTNKMPKWSAALGLDKDQQGKLRNLADQQFDEMAAMEQTVEGGDPTAISDSTKQAMAVRPWPDSWDHFNHENPE